MLVEKGDKGRKVKEIQTLLQYQGFWTYSKITDYFGDVTEKAVKLFQSENNLQVDGKVGGKTMALLLRGVDSDQNTLDDSQLEDTDNKLDHRGIYNTTEGLEIDRIYLDTDEYVRDYGKLEMWYNFIHHTAGSHNPLRTIDNWNKDSRGRIATQYAIGGIDKKDGDSTYNGKVIECLPDNYFGWHLGETGNFEMHKHSVATEINNYGYLTKKDNKFYNAYNSLMPDSMVCDLGYEFKGNQYWHNYTYSQMDSLELLFKHIKEKHPNLPISRGLPDLLRNGVHPSEAFDFQEDAYYGRVKGTWTHTNVRTGKMDCYPHPKLVEILKNL